MMRVFERCIPLVLLIGLAIACKSKEVSPEAILNPWEPIDPGFVGCEGG